MQVEIFSDVACPFCYVGKRQFEAALERYPHADEVEVTWRSFQLDPTMPETPAGSITDHLSRKYRVSLEEAGAMNERVRLAGDAVGIEFDFDRAQPVNTFRAHQLLQAAADQGLADEAGDALFSAYFTDGINVHDLDSLVKIAAEVGLDPDTLRKALTEDAYADRVKDDIATASSLGLTAVPAFVIDRALLVSGAQPADAFVAAMDQAREREGS